MTVDMSSYFFIHNLVFTFGMVGAIVFMASAWLSFDAYRIRHDFAVLARAIGCALISVWHLMNAVTLENDVLSYLAFVVLVVGLVSILSSFLKKSEIVAHAIIIVPAFSLWVRELHFISMALLFAIAYLAWRQGKIEYNRTWRAFTFAFLSMGVSSLVIVISGTTTGSDTMTVLSLVFNAVGSVFVGYWVWQYMQLRIKELIVLGLVSASLLLATLVTLAFSTILINRVTIETSKSLATDVHVFSFMIDTLKDEALVKARFSATDSQVVQALSTKNFSSLNQILERVIEEQGLGLLMVTDMSGEVLVRAHALSRRGDTVSGERVFEEASRGVAFATIEKGLVEGLSIRAGAPIIKDGKVVGVIIAGYPMDNAFADRMKRLTGLELFIYDGAMSVVSTAFASDGVTRLVGSENTDRDVRDTVLGAGKELVDEIQVSGERFHAGYLPLLNADDKVIGMLAVAKHQSDIIAIANATNRLTLITVIVIVLALIAPMYILNKRINIGV
jgi:hypothetical protein